MPVDLTLHDPDADDLLDPSESIRRSILPGGVRLLTQQDTSVRSASIGLWLPVGSRHERPEHAGSTHALEHLLFKGTQRRSALEIAAAFDEVGGDSNAVTAKEHTLYHGRVRSADLPRAIDVLSDMVTSSRLEASALETEREVILEELAAAYDDPHDIGYETFLADVLGPDTPMGRPVGGTVESVTALGIEDVRAHWHEHYQPQNLVVTAVGDLEHEDVAGLLVEALHRGGWSLEDGALPSGPRVTEPSAPDQAGGQAGGADPAGAAGRSGRIPAPHRLHRPSEQTHVYLGGPGLTATSEDRHTLSVLMSILGGGMSSRLFQNIRERLGLVYSVQSFSAGYSDAGLFCLYAACRPARAEQVADLMVQEVEQLAEHGVTREELDRARGQLAGAFALGLEDTTSRMGRLGAIELIHGRYQSVDEILDRIEHVSARDVRELAARFAAQLTTRVDVGPDAA